MKKLYLSIVICLIVFCGNSAFSQNKAKPQLPPDDGKDILLGKKNQDKEKPPAETKTAVSKNAEKAVPEQFQARLSEMFNLKEASRITYTTAKQLLTDDSGCVKQTLLLLQRDMEAKENYFLVKLAELRDQLDLGKDWQLDLQNMKFIQVKKPTPQP